MKLGLLKELLDRSSKNNFGYFIAILVAFFYQDDSGRVVVTSLAKHLLTLRSLIVHLEGGVARAMKEVLVTDMQKETFRSLCAAVDTRMLRLDEAEIDMVRRQITAVVEQLTNTRRDRQKRVSMDSVLELTALMAIESRQPTPPSLR